jgi:hypothetical protein
VNTLSPEVTNISCQNLGVENKDLNCKVIDTSKGATLHFVNLTDSRTISLTLQQVGSVIGGKDLSLKQFRAISRLANIIRQLI